MENWLVHSHAVHQDSSIIWYVQHVRKQTAHPIALHTSLKVPSL